MCSEVTAAKLALSIRLFEHVSVFVERSCSTHHQSVKSILNIFYIHAMNLAGIDLNLLVAFDALLTERSVTRAATRIGLSQPAMSNALARLRTVVGDPLFVRTPRGMTPTARAKALSERVRFALKEIQSALEDVQAFDAKSSIREFNVATTDYANLMLLPRLLHRLKEIAPKVRVRVRPLHRAHARLALQVGELDLGIAWRLEEAPFDSQGFYTKALFEEQLVCIVRKDHPTVRDRLKIAQFLRLEHVVVGPPDEYILIVDQVLAHKGLKRRVAVTVPEATVSPFIIAQTDMIASVPARVARLFSKTLPLRILPLPVRLPPLTVRLLWHERNHTDPGHQWLRIVLSDLGSEQ
jgi:DNA-binding transcriptional LysR family regulator